MITLEHFRGEGAICGVICPAAWKNKALLDPVKRWIAEGKLSFAPGQDNVLMDTLYLVEPGIDKTRWPYLCGQIAKRAGLNSSEKTHGLAVGSDCHRHWMAGWEAG